MKLAELKEKLKNKYTVRIIAGVLVIAIAGTGAGYGLTSIKADVNTESAESAVVTTSEEEDEVADKLLDSISVSEDEVDKEESVYLLSDASGNVKETIVVNHLKNLKGEATLKDESKLSDIENVKGDETFKQDGSSVTWQADGNEIYYRGTTTEEAPISQKVTYFLDGNEISPEDLAGKSGKVTIRFDYTNNTTYKETINGKEYEVAVPFVAATALSLGNGFSNIEVTNGKTETTANGTLVLGYALPGLKDSLKVDEDSLEDITIPEYFEVTADVENFELTLAMTYVSNAGNLLSADGTSAFDSVDDSIDEITDAMDQLMDGGDKLSNGADELSEGAGKLATGAGKLESGLTKLDKNMGTFKKGVNDLKKGIKAYTDGADTLNTGLKTLQNGTSTLASGAKALDDGADALATGASSLQTGLAAYTAGVDALNNAEKGMPALAAGASQVSAGVDTVVDSMKAMPDTIAASINTSLNELNTSGFATAVYGSGYTGDTAGKITLANLSAITTYVAANETAIEQAIVVGGMMKQGMTKEQAVGVLTKIAQNDPTTVATYGAVVSEANTKAKQGYANALVGLYQAQGAASVYSAVKTTVDSKSTDLETLKAGAKSVATGANTAKEGVSKLAANNKTLNAGAKSLSDGCGELAKGTQSLVESVPSLTSGISQLVTGSNTLVANNKDLNDGAKKLATGTNSIVSGVGQLQKGSVDLSEGADKLSTGSQTLADGADTLADGLVQFNQKGIEKLVNAYNGDLKPLADRLQVVMDAADSYSSFTGLSDGQKGSVKFIYKLDSIEASDAE